MAVVLDLQQSGQIQTAGPFLWICGAPNGTGNLAAGEQWNYIPNVKLLN